MINRIEDMRYVLSDITAYFVRLYNKKLDAFSSIVEHGILSIKELNDKKIVVRSLEQIERLSESD